MYISRYEAYPIYEPAEGGYYYWGWQLVESYKVRHGRAKKKLRQIARTLEKEAAVMRGSRFCYTPNMTAMYGRYIGDGTKYVIESRRHIGREERGWRPYE